MTKKHPAGPRAGKSVQAPAGEDQNLAKGTKAENRSTREKNNLCARSVIDKKLNGRDPSPALG